MFDRREEMIVVVFLDFVGKVFIYLVKVFI